jgi:hypothetical protein
LRGTEITVDVVKGYIDVPLGLADFPVEIANAPKALVGGRWNRWFGVRVMRRGAILRRGRGRGILRMDWGRCLGKVVGRTVLWRGGVGMIETILLKILLYDNRFDVGLGLETLKLELV